MIVSFFKIKSNIFMEKTEDVTMAEHECSQERRLEEIEKNQIETKGLLNKFDFIADQIVKTNEKQTVLIENLQKSNQDLTISTIKLSNTLEKVNDNMDGMHKEIKKTNERVDELNKQFEESEKKNITIIDQREWLNKIFRKILLPVGGVSGGIFAIYEILNLLGVFSKS
jgi:uncharacterized coiled-coil DUF342 family protein